MSPAFHGADPKELRAFANELDRAQDTLMAVRHELSARINNNLRWEGPDAFVFKHAWQSSYAPVIARTAAELRHTAQLVRAQAAAQESASS